MNNTQMEQADPRLIANPIEAQVLARHYVQECSASFMALIEGAARNHTEGGEPFAVTHAEMKEFASVVNSKLGRAVAVIEATERWPEVAK